MRGLAMPDPLRMKAKVCLVGDAAVGKTALVRRFVHDEFDDRYVATLGAKVSKKEVPVGSPEPVLVAITIWDIMGHRPFNELLREAYFSGAQGILGVCDVTRAETLRGLADWIASVHREAGSIPVVILANKADLAGERVVTEDDVGGLAREHGCPHRFTSAKTGQGVASGFESLATMIGERAQR